MLQWYLNFWHSFLFFLINHRGRFLICFNPFVGYLIILQYKKQKEPLGQNMYSKAKLIYKITKTSDKQDKTSQNRQWPTWHGNVLKSKFDNPGHERSWVWIPLDPMRRASFSPIPWQAAEKIGGLLATEWQSHRVTDTQGYSVYRWVKFFLPDFNKLPFLLGSQGDKTLNLHFLAMAYIACCWRKPICFFCAIPWLPPR